MSIIAAEPTPIELTLPACSLCSMTNRKVLRFNLVRDIPATATQRHTTRGAGCINLCERCWRAAVREADKHMARRRPRRQRAA